MEGQVTVLVVDDDASIRLLCRVNLELEGHAVVEASTLADARAALAGNDIDVVILDVHVGADDARVLLDELRASRPELPVALLTGTAEPRDALRAGADALIPKPFEIDQLRDTVERLAAGRPS